MQGTWVGFSTTAGEVIRVGAERRRCERFGIRLPGEIGADTARTVDCEVRDYCSGGMLVMLAGTGIGLVPIMFHSRRMNCMGVLLAPAILRMAGLGPVVARWLGLV